MTNLQLLLIAGVGLLAIMILHLWADYFPKTRNSNFRIKEKSKGKYIYYKAQVKRPIFGWSDFYASKTRGSINVMGDYDLSKSEAEYQIRVYKNLRPLNPED